MYRLLYKIIFSLTLLGGLTSCATDFNQWEGSVDAVFKYRSSEGTTLVHEIRPDSFSKEAGLKPDDVLLAVDNKSVRGASYYEVREALRGPVGTTVILTVQRGEEILDVPVERRPISKK